MAILLGMEGLAMPNIDSFSHGLPVASGAVAMGILDALVKKGVVTRAEARSILQNAITALENSNINAAVDAAKLIRNDWLPEYAD
jgi:hypothetical protein